MHDTFKRKTVLVVDDEDLIVNSLSRFLSKKGYRVLSTTLPEKALSLYATEKIDMVITDMKMGNIDGIEIIRHLRDSGYKGRIVVMSAYLRDYEEALGAYQVDACLEKPFSLEDFYARIRELENEKVSR